jgi:ankyrin repeat protein
LRACALSKTPSLILRLRCAQASTPDGAGRLPLHAAAVASGGAGGAAGGAAVVAHLLASHPAGARARDASGATALHLACAYGAPLAVVAALTAAAPECAKERAGAVGATPLHFAAGRKASHEVVAHLLVRVVAVCLPARRFTFCARAYLTHSRFVPFL